MSEEFKDVKEEILELTKNKPKKREYALRKLEDFHSILFKLRVEKLHGKKFLKF